jgi:hypothetical protein
MPTLRDLKPGTIFVFAQSVELAGDTNYRLSGFRKIVLPEGKEGIIDKQWVAMPVSEETLDKSVYVISLGN